MFNLFKIITIIIIFSIITSGCSVVKKFAGADIDPVQFAKAREAKMLTIRSAAAEKLVKRLKDNGAIDDADMTCTLNSALLNKIAKNYDFLTGALDENTTYKIISTKLSLYYGCAIASLAMDAHNEKYNVDVKLTTDCLIFFETEKNELVMKLEPFNISPDVTAGGLLSSSDEIIRNLIKINMANLGNSIPSLKIPLDINNSMKIPGSNMEIKEKVNLKVINPERKIDYSLKLKELLIFRDKVFVAMNISKLEVK